MEVALQIQIEELPEGFYLATCDELPGLVAQGKTVAETLDIARDVAKNLIEARREREGDVSLQQASDRRDYTIVVAAQRLECPSRLQCRRFEPGFSFAGMQRGVIVAK